MHKEDGTVLDIMYGKEDHGILTCWIQIQFPETSQQSFGGFAIPNVEALEAYLNELRGLFDLTPSSPVEEIVGKSVTALRNNSKFGLIKGLEVGGRRFTLEVFDPKKPQNPVTSGGNTTLWDRL